MNHETPARKGEPANELERIVIDSAAWGGTDYPNTIEIELEALPEHKRREQARNYCILFIGLLAVSALTILALAIYDSSSLFAGKIIALPVLLSLAGIGAAFRRM